MRARLVPLAVAVLTLSSACSDPVIGPVAPPVIQSADSLVFLANSSVNLWWSASTSHTALTMLESTADALTGNCCWARFNNLEPRIPYSNGVGSADSFYALDVWDGNHAAINNAAEVLASLDAGVAIPGGVSAAERVRAAALFSMAASYANLANLFDSALVKTRPTSPTVTPRLQSYTVARDTSMVYWDALIALTAGKSWQWDASVLPLVPTPPTASTINRIARTMAARTLVLSARTAAGNAQTNWSRVLGYADGGLTGTGVSDLEFAVAYDLDRWYNLFQVYGSDDDRFRVDQRLIRRMASNIPAEFRGMAAQPVPISQDNRLVIANLPCSVQDPLPCLQGVTADYVYMGTVIGDPGRGIYMQSPFAHLRNVGTSWRTPAAERLGRPQSYIRAAENDLMIAEALARSGGSLVRAAALVNETHVGRGGRAPVQATLASVLAGIEYERDVELLNTGGIALFDRRRVDGLQAGTFRQLPVPGRVLQELGKAAYSYGGGS